MKTIFLRFAVLFASILAVCVSVQAQSPSGDAHLYGTLTDPAGAGAADVHVTAKLEGLPDAQVYRATSAGDGSYRLAYPAGRYHIHISRTAFVARDFIFDFAAGESRALDLRFDLEPLSSSVVVTAQGEPTLAQETSASVTEITRDEIDKRQSVPLADLLLYTPGIAVGKTGAEGGLTSLFVNGGNSYQAKVLVDGTTVNAKPSTPQE